MNKQRLILMSVIAVLALGFAAYRFWPVFVGSRASTVQEIDSATIPDRFYAMNPQTKKEFDGLVEETKNNEIALDEARPEKTKVLQKADLKKRAFPVQGRALLLQQGDKMFIRMEDLLTQNGPNLHILLSPELGALGALDIGPLRATKGNVNYEIPGKVNPEKYKYVLIWSVDYRVIWSYAIL